MILKSTLITLSFSIAYFSSSRCSSKVIIVTNKYFFHFHFNMKQYLLKLDDNEAIVRFVYLISPAHRKFGNPHKSIWVIKPKEEFGCFCYSIQNGWIEEDDAWGYLLDANSKFVVIGEGVNGEDLKIARFKSDPNAEQWHGYPCNYMANSYDVPPETILKKWVSTGTINKAKMSKIQRCLSCNL